MAFNMVLPKPLDAVSNRELMEKKAAGDEYARDKLIEGNMRLVTHSAYKFKNTGIDYDDLVSVGSIGLMKAVDSFKLEKEIKFATYAARCIDNEILMLLRKNKKHKGVIGLDEVIAKDTSSGNELSLADITPDNSIPHFSEAVIYDDVLVEVRDLLAALPPLHQRVLNLRYMQNQTQKQVSKALNLSQSYISRLEKSAARRIRDAHEMKEVLFEENLASQRKSKGDVVEMAGKGNRQEAIRLLEKTTLSYKQISDRTGVPSGTVGTMAGKHRPKHVRDQIKEDILLQQQIAREVKAANQLPTKREPSPAIQEVIRKFDTPQTTLDLAVNKITTVANEKASKEVFAFLDEDTPDTDVPDEKSIGDALEEYRLEVEKDVRAKIEAEMVAASHAEQASKAEEPIKEEKKSKINRKLGFTYDANGTDLEPEDIIEELEILIQTIKDGNHNKVSFSMTLTAD